MVEIRQGSMAMLSTERPWTVDLCSGFQSRREGPNMSAEAAQEGQGSAPETQLDALSQDACPTGAKGAQGDAGEDAAEQYEGTAGPDEDEEWKEEVKSIFQDTAKIVQEAGFDIAEGIPLYSPCIELMKDRLQERYEVENLDLEFSIATQESLIAWCAANCRYSGNESEAGHRASPARSP